VLERILTHLGVVGATAAARAGAARGTISGGLIRKPGLVLAGADGTARLALVQARGFGGNRTLQRARVLGKRRGLRELSRGIVTQLTVRSAGDRVTVGEK
jgi:hypothetical protein